VDRYIIGFGGSGLLGHSMFQKEAAGD